MNTTRHITPHWVSSLNENEIFVFGCRRSGRHWEGAALFAHENFGAVFGQGEGRQGQAYAIPTVGYGVDLNHIRNSVGRFTEYAMCHPELHFLVTAIGCGVGGWRASDIAPLFVKTAKLDNVWLPQEFWDVLDDHSNNL